ncbi:hypothetical protein LXL04_011880 [Taraxacum kok-saghyz]
MSEENSGGHLAMGERETISDYDSMSTLATRICNQINSVFTESSTSTSSPLDITVDEISSAAARGGKVFVYGVGREGLMMKALCMRLAHLGLSAHCVGDMTTPPISSSDLLIASAGPGGFSTVDAICGVAKTNGARVLVLTAQPESGSSVKYASVVAYIAAQTMADDGVETRPLLLPMGSVYEGAMFVLFEMVFWAKAPIKSDLATPIWSKGVGVRREHPAEHLLTPQKVLLRSGSESAEVHPAEEIGSPQKKKTFRRGAFCGILPEI